MKRGTTEHPKFSCLCLRLGLDPWEGQGLLEAIWHFTARFSPRGDIGRWGDDQVARGIGWRRGEPNEMIRALVTERWLDDHDEHRILVHDWSQHCDDSVHMALARAGLLFADGTMPKMTRLTHGERERIEGLFRAHGKRTASARQAQKSAYMRTKSAIPPLPSPPPPCPALQEEKKEKIPPAPRSAPPSQAEREHPKTAVIWAAYSAAYRDHYGAEPQRNAKVNGQLVQFAKRVSMDEAPLIAAWYVSHPLAWYVRCGHAIDCLLKDAEKLRMEWKTGRITTETEARRAERTAANPFVELAREERQARRP